jgi:hypothetical protein
MSQTSVPTGPTDIDVIGWSPTPVFSQINSLQANDSRYVSVPTDQIGVFEVRLANLAWPETGTETFKVRLRQTGTSATTPVLVWLEQGSTLVAARTINLVGSNPAFTTYPYALTSAERALITDYTNLRMKVFRCSGTQTYTMSNTWVCPAGVTQVIAECWGAGGKGAAGSNTPNRSGGGGGGGAYARSASLAVTPGSSYTVNVAQRAGDVTYFVATNTVSAVSGSDANAEIGGAGGIASSCVGVITTNGGRGGSGAVVATGSGGGGGGSGSGSSDGSNGTNAVGSVPGVGGRGQGNGGHGGQYPSGLQTGGENGFLPGGGGGGGEATAGPPGIGAYGQVTLYW